MNPDLYLRVRDKEGRLYSDEVVRRLPDFFSADNRMLWDEWHARSASASRLTRYLSHRPELSSILDVGCGNGWLSNLLSGNGHSVIGVDRNQVELRQAARVFSHHPKLSFIDADTNSFPFETGTFDMILLASVIQYFDNLHSLIRSLLSYLKPQGEIHILDSPLYKVSELEDARERSRQYYTSIGFPEMANYYFHHDINSLNEFSFKTLYHPDVFSVRLRRRLGGMDSPFPWIVIRGNKE